MLQQTTPTQVRLPRQHEASLYDADADLTTDVVGFLAPGLADGDTAVVVATPEHREVFEAGLRAHGVDVHQCLQSGQLLMVDAAETLHTLQPEGQLDPDLAATGVHRLLDQIARDGHEILFYGEMVNLLWHEGNVVGALALEDLLHDVQAHRHFRILCGYQITDLDRAQDDGHLAMIRQQHSDVHLLPAPGIPAACTETALDTEGPRLSLDVVIEHEAAGIRAHVPGPQGRRITTVARRHEDLEPTVRTTDHQMAACLQAVTSQLTEGLLILDPSGAITHANPCAEWMLTAPRGSALGSSFVDRLCGEQDTPVRRDTTGRPDGRGPVIDQVLEDLLVQADGRTLPIEYTATALPEACDGQAKGWAVVLRDISDERARRERLAASGEHARWRERIRHALQADQFVLHAQPLVDLASGDITRHELLIRLDDPDEGLILPGAFLPAAEAYGLAPSIDRWVLVQAVDLAAEGHPVQINLSAHSFADPSLPHLVDHLLTETGADPGLLLFELTETAMLDDDQAVTRFADRIHALGCQLALDDFGTGYGAFTYLKRLPVDMLKIDIDFVRDALMEPASRHVITAVVSLAHSFGMTTVAEGVEDQATLDLLAELGVDQAQGYHLARPAPLSTFGLDRPAGPARSTARPRTTHSPRTQSRRGPPITTIEDRLATTVNTERRRRRMTAKDLAHAAQVDPATVRRLLAAKGVRISTVRSVLDALQLHWDDTIAPLGEPSVLPAGADV